MKRNVIVGMGMGLAASLLMPVSAQANLIGDEGCTPGYWKNHTESWSEAPGAPIPSGTLLTAAGFAPTSAFAGDSLLDALNYGGGPGASGAEMILLRAAAAAWLNAASEELGYPYRRYSDPYNITATVNAAIASGHRATMLAVAAELDAANNLGCPL